MIGGVILLGGAGVCLAIIGLLVAAGIALASELGAAWAIGIVSLALLVLATATILGSKLWLRHSAATCRRGIEQRIDQAESELKGNAPTHLQNASAGKHSVVPGDSGGVRPERDGAEGPTDVKQRVAECIAENPATTAGGAFALLALVGPMRSLRLLGRGVMLAGLASRVHRELRANETGAVHEDSSDGRG